VVMTTTLISKPGITSASNLAIPKAWDGTWFRNLISTQLTGADVRNAIAGPGITITGNLSTPYATISAGGAGAPFVAPIIVKTSGGVTVFEVFNSTTGPTIEAYGPTAGTLVDLTPDFGTFTGTLVGLTTSPTVTCAWARVGRVVTLTINANSATVTGTSNSAGFAMTGLPAEIQTATYYGGTASNWFENNSTPGVAGQIQIAPAAGTLTFYLGGGVSGSTWTASGTKGLIGQMSISYSLD
jgi:hypothetical protein